MGPVATAAQQRALVTLTGTVTSDPRRIEGRFGDRVLVRVAVGRHQPVLVFGDDAWERVAIGERIRFTGRLAPVEDAGDLAATVTPRGPPETAAAAGAAWRATEALRASIRDAVAHRPASQRALVPALVDGDDAGMPPGLVEDFRTTGLTHLTAVSGTNLTLVVGFLLVVARWVGVRGRWLGVVGVAGIVGFVLLARTEPSVLRAAAMGAVALVGLGRGGWHRGVRGLGAAVVGLLLVEPGPGEHGGVRALGARDRRHPAGRAVVAGRPGALAAALARRGGRGAGGGPAGVHAAGRRRSPARSAWWPSPPTWSSRPSWVRPRCWGCWAAWSAWSRTWSAGWSAPLAGWCVAWIVVVAEHGAALPGAALDWGTTPWSLALLVVTTAAVVAAGPVVLRHRTSGAAACLLLVVVTVAGPPSPGWPPSGWVFAACDVGQGDALVLRAGPGAAVVVDAGPDPRAVDGCLRRLGVDRVPLLVLTHFHADHVDGLAGVLDHREVGEVEVTRLADPPGGVAAVAAETADAGLTTVVAAYGETRTVGDVTLQVLWPTPASPTTGPGDGSTANEASVVLLAEVAGVRLLLTGDIEPVGQAALARALPGLRVDVLKVPHHGSRYQDHDWLASLGARYAVVSVGADNDYGHPAAETLDALDAARAPRCCGPTATATWWSPSATDGWSP